MVVWIENYFICLLGSVLLAGFIIPNIMSIAFQRKLFDEIDERKIHKGVVPRLGGVAFLPSFLCTFCLVIGCNIRLNVPEFEGMLRAEFVPVFFLLCALMLMYLVGIADDLVGVRYRAKFIFQILASALIILSGSWICSLGGLFGVYTIPTILGWAITVFLVLYVVNAINLIDGIDGLASGLSMIALVFYSVLFYKAGEYAYAFLAGATLGTLVPFFYFNVFGKAERHTKIFMGDAGSLTIGIVLAFLSIRVFWIPADKLLADGNVLILALAPIMVPCFDVARVFLHRVRRKKNPFLPDKCHIHHKLLALGCRQWQALVSILLVDAAFIVANLWLSPYVETTLLIVIDMLLYSGLNIVLTRMIRTKEHHAGVTLYE